MHARTQNEVVLTETAIERQRLDVDSIYTYRERERIGGSMRIC